MSELAELENGLRKLKEDNLEKRRLISQMEREKKYLDERNKYLIEKLKQAGVLYEEAGKRVMDFVKDNIKPLKAKFADFDSRLSKVKEYDRSINSALKTVADLSDVMNGFRNEIIKTEEREAALSANVKELRKTSASLSKRISAVQTVGSEELAEKVEEIKAKFGEDVREIEDEFNVFKIGVGNTVDDFRKEFEREAGSLRREMEKVDVKKAKELYEAMEKMSSEMEKTNKDFSKALNSIGREIERLDLKKTKEMDKSMEMLSTNLNERFEGFAGDMDKRVKEAEKELNVFRVELEKTLSKAKTETRDLVDTKSKEIDLLMEELKAKTNDEMGNALSEWNENLGNVRSDLIRTKEEVEKLIGTVNRKVELGEERRQKQMDTALTEMHSSLSEVLEGTKKEIYVNLNGINADFGKVKSDLSKTISSLKNRMESNEIKRRDEVDKIVKEFLTVKGGVDEKINEISERMAEFSQTSEALRKQILKESLAGVKSEFRGTVEEIGKKFEDAEQGFIEKIVGVQNTLDESNANLQSLVNSTVSDFNGKMDSMRKEFEKRDSRRDRSFGKFSESVKSDADEAFVKLRGETETGIKGLQDEVFAVRKEMDNFTINLKDKFDEIIKEKSKDFQGMVDSLTADMKSTEKDISKVISSFRKEMETNEIQRRDEIDKILKEFLTAKGEVDEKIQQLESQISEFSGISEQLRKGVLKESLMGVQKEVKGIVEDIGKKFENVENGMIEKIVGVQNALDESNANLQSLVSSTAADFGSRMDSLRKEFEKRDSKRDNSLEKFSETMREGIDGRFTAMDGRLRELIADADAKISSAETGLNNFKVELEKTVGRLTADVNGVTSSKTKEIDDAFNDARKQMRDDLKQVISDMNKRVSEVEGDVSGLRAGLEKTVSGLKEDVDMITAKRSEKTDEVVEKAKESLRLSLNEAKAGIDERVKEIEGDLKTFRTGLEKSMGELRKDMGSLTSKKTEKMDEIVERTKAEVDEKLKSLISETSEKMTFLSNEINSSRDEFGRKVDSVKKEVERGDARREEKLEKTRAKLEKEMIGKIDDFIRMTEDRIKNAEGEVKILGKETDKVVGDLRTKFDVIIKEKSKDFENIAGGIARKSETAEKEMESLVGGLEKKFEAGEKERWKEVDKSIKELTTAKGQADVRLKDVEGQLNKLSAVRDDIKNELMKGTSVMMDNRLTSLSSDMKTRISDSRKSLKESMKDLDEFTVNLEAKFAKTMDRIDIIKDDIVSIKKSRDLVLGDVKSLNRSSEDNVDSRLKSFMGDIEKRMRTQEKLLNSRISEIEGKISSVSGRAEKTKKQKEEELDELLKHVES